MSIEATRAAWGQRGISSTAKLVLLALADCVNSHSAICRPSITRISEMTGLSRRTIFNALNALESADLIERDSGNTGRATRYALNLNTRAAPAPTHAPDARVTSAPDAPVQPVTRAPRAPTSAPRAPEPERNHKELFSSPLGARERRARARGDALSLSLIPQGDLIQVAREVRPDLTDPQKVLKKFAAYNNGNEYTPERWENKWRVWLLNERETRSSRQTTIDENRKPGGFLAQQDEIKADYRVINR